MDALLKTLLPTLHALFVRHETTPCHRRAWRFDDAAQGSPQEPPQELPLGCGWFDSSHELASGLGVQELATPEALAQALPLGSWLELELAACSR